MWRQTMSYNNNYQESLLISHVQYYNSYRPYVFLQVKGVYPDYT